MKPMPAFLHSRHSSCDEPKVFWCRRFNTEQAEGFFSFRTQCVIVNYDISKHATARCKSHNITKPPDSADRERDVSQKGLSDLFQTSGALSLISPITESLKPSTRCLRGQLPGYEAQKYLSLSGIPQQDSWHDLHKLQLDV